jgi:hypothetical protein
MTARRIAARRAVSFSFTASIPPKQADQNTAPAIVTKPRGALDEYGQGI